MAWAAVSEAGELGSNRGVKDVSMPKSGVYHLTFERSLAQCATFASIRGAELAFVTVELEAKDELALVHTFAADGKPAERSFSVAVYCAET